MASEYNTDPGQGYRIPKRKVKRRAQPPPPPAGMPYRVPKAPKVKYPYTGFKKGEHRRVHRFKKTKQYKRSIRVAREARKRRDLEKAVAISKLMALHGRAKVPVIHHEGAVEGLLKDIGMMRLRSETQNETMRAIAHPGASLDKLLKARQAEDLGKMGIGPSDLKAPLAVKDIAEALYEKPGKTLGSTAKSIPKLLVGIAPGVVTGLADPVKAGKAIAKDYKRRYKHAGSEKNVKRIQEEGFLPEALDASTVAAVAGRTTRLAARSGLSGKAAKAKAEAPRPRLKSGPGRAVEQETSKNAIIAKGQRALDRERAKAQKRRVRRVKRDQDVDTDRREFLRVEEAAGPEPGTVVPLTRLGARSVRARRFQEEQGRFRVRQRRRVGEEVTKGSRKSEGELSRSERKAFAYALEGHVPLHGTASAKIAALERLEEFIKRNRAERKTQIRGRAAKKYNDELRTIAYLKQHVDEAFTERLAQVVERERLREQRLAADDPALSTQRAELSRTGPQAELLIGVRREGESVAAYQSRARAAREEADLPEPGYIKHQGEPFQEKRSDYALGTGKHGTSREPRRRTGEAFRTGRRDVRMEVLHQSRAQNIKRSEQWNFVIRNAEDNAIKQIKDADTGELIDLSEGKPIRELVEAVDRSALDPNDLAFVKVGKLRQEGQRLHRTLDDEDMAGQAAQAFKENAKSYEDALDMIRDPEQVKNDTGWHIIPKDIAQQQEAVTHQGLAGRVVRKYIKGIPSKLLLGTNPSWAILQILNNQFLAALGGVGPIDIAKSLKFFKQNAEARKAMDDYLGATTFEAERAGVRIGAAAPKLKLLEQWRALKATPLAQRAGRANPLDWLFRLDHHNNTIHRRAVAYDFLRGEAYKGMGRDVVGFGAAMKRLEHTFDLGPQDQILALLKNPAALEKAANHVDSLLGNYVRYTPLERRLLEGNIMFYGFLRFSLRFTLYTLPVKHPIKANILANLSRLHEREVRGMLGLKKNDPLPPGALASYYRVKDGKITEIPLQRLNPAMNVFTQGDPRIESLLLAAPPIVTAATDQFYHEDLFTGKAHKIRGESTARETPSNRQKYPEFDVRVFAGDALRLIAPYREWERIAFEGRPQGADSLAFATRPTLYKTPEIKRSINQSAKRQRRKSVVRRVGEGQLPFIFRESDIRRRTKQFLEDEFEASGKKKPSSSGYYGGGSSSGGYYR